jgi:hypothetical protein
MEIREAVDFLTEWLVEAKKCKLSTGYLVIETSSEFEEALGTLLMEFEYKDYESKMP